MREEILKYFKLILGVFIAALGIVLTVKSNLGLSPWDVLHQGLAMKLSITLGQGNIIISVLVISVAIFLGGVVGSGSIITTFLFGIFVDLIMYMNIISVSQIFLYKIAMMVLGTFLFSYGTYMCISAGLGCGPRDSLMIGFSQKTGFSMGKIRNFMEIGVLSIGFFLGGSVGIGTLISAVSVGFFLQLIFSYHNYNPNETIQRDLMTEIRYLTKGFR